MMHDVITLAVTEAYKVQEPGSNLITTLLIIMPQHACGNLVKA